MSPASADAPHAAVVERIPDDEAVAGDEAHAPAGREGQHGADGQRPCAGRGVFAPPSSGRGATSRPAAHSQRPVRLVVRPARPPGPAPRTSAVAVRVVRADRVDRAARPPTRPCPALAARSGSSEQPPGGEDAPAAGHRVEQVRAGVAPRGSPGRRGAPSSSAVVAAARRPRAAPASRRGATRAAGRDRYVRRSRSTIASTR